MGKGGQVVKRSGKSSSDNTPIAKEKLEVLVDGNWYDISNMKSHPGGSVIKFYAGKDIDATQAFNNFHVRSKKARKWLEALPSRPATNLEATTNNKIPGQSALLDDFNKLTQELENEGFFEPAPLHIVYRIFEIIAMHAVGLYLLLQTEWMVTGIIVLGVVSGRCGWLMHEGGHYSLTGNISIDRALQVVLYGVGCGMSGSWWRSQHNKHHSMPQKEGFDPDLNTLPLVAFTEKVVKRIGIPMKLWLRMQAFLFPVVTCQLVALGWQLYLHPRHVLRQKKWDEGICMLARYALWHTFITSKFGLAGSALVYLAYNQVASDSIFINFAVSHTHLPTVAKDDDKVDWVRYAAIHTMNVSPGPFGVVNWWMSFLNFQIEHHLFPSMPQFRHPIVSHRVKALFEKHGLKYDQRDYLTSMKVTFQNLDHVGADVFYG